MNGESAIISSSVQNQILHRNGDVTPSTVGTNNSEHHHDHTTTKQTRNSPKRQPSSPQVEATVETEVCCGCRPKQRRYKKRSTQSIIRSHRFSLFRNQVYFDANSGLESEWRALERHVQCDNNNVDDEDDSQYFFDAVDQPLGEEEYPIEGYVVKRGSELGDYPIIFTTSLRHPSPHFESLEDPKTWLHKSFITEHSITDGEPDSGSRDYDDDMEQTRNDAEDENDDRDDGLEDFPHRTSIEKSKRSHRPRFDSHLSGASGDTIQSHKEPSMRFFNIKQRSPLLHKIHLEDPRVKSRGLQGYPGELTMEEMQECQKFLQHLADLPTEVAQQVYSFRDIEEEPYTICRWLRATKFDADKILERLIDNQPMFDRAKMEEFYPNVAESIGAPLSVFLSQYPFLPVGRGKNGCPVNYFLAGKINPEGILCLTTIRKLECYFWYSFMWKFKNEIRAAQELDPDFVRVEGINIIELDGLSSSALTSETMEVIKLASKISDFFPETLHCMLVLNAPSFFALAWGLIKKFIDPRTAARIQLFANRDKGQIALEKLIDKSQLPSDYGGGSMSLREAFLKEASDPALIRQEIELLHCKRKSKSHSNCWTLQSNENIHITLYTRSVSTGHVSINMNGQRVRSFTAKCLVNGENGNHDEEEPGTPLPNRIITKVLAGPGEVIVDVKDMDDSEKRHSGKSKGYFLVVGDVKTRTAVKPNVKQQQPQKMAVTMAGLSGSSNNEVSSKRARLK